VLRRLRSAIPVVAPEAERVSGAVALIDVGRFSAFAGRVSSRGGDGVEQLSTRINDWQGSSRRITSHAEQRRAPHLDQAIQRARTRQRRFSRDGTMINSTPSRRTAVAALVLLLVAPCVATAACPGRSAGRSSGRPATKRPLIINVPREYGSKPPCPQQPRSSCQSPGLARLVVKDSRDDKNDVLIWKWSRGDAFAEADINEPSATEFAICVYDSFENVPLRIATLAVKPGGSWTRNKSAGVTDLLLKSGTKGKARVRVKATGQRLRLPSPANRTRFFHKDGSVVVQLVNVGSDKCWTSTFTTARENLAASFVAP